MLLRALVVVSLLISGLLAPPASAAPVARSAPAAVPAAVGTAAGTATLGQASAGMPLTIQAAKKKKPRAALTASRVSLVTGKIRVSVTSNAKKVKLTYRTAKNKKRTATIKIRKRAGAKTLPKGSKKIYAQARATSKRRASVKIVVPPAKVPTAFSDGVSPTTVEYGPVTVTSAAGAIRAGQSLSIAVRSTLGPGLSQAMMLAGPFELSTSQGQPAGQVTVRFTYAPSALSPGSRPVVLHENTATGGWLPEDTTWDTPTGIATTTLTSFSGVGLVDWGLWSVGVVTGNRATDALVCSPAPDWITNTAFTPPSINGQPANVNARLWSCPGPSDASIFRLQLQNNRNYVQSFRVGMDYDAQRSAWPTDTAAALHTAFSRLRSSEERRLVVLAPGERVTLAFQRPAGLVGSQRVLFAELTSFGAGVAAMYMSLLYKTPNPVATTLSVADCAAYGISSSASGSTTTVTASKDQFDACVQAGIDISGEAKQFLVGLAWAIFAADVATKIIDGFSDAMPLTLEFTIKGLPAVTPDIQLTNGALGSIPAGQATTRQLTATGGTAPYTWVISTGTANTGRVPSWASLNSSGQLRLEVPAGNSSSYSFYVTIRSANGQSSATATQAVSFTTTSPGTGIDPPADTRAGSDWIARNPTTGAAVHVKDGNTYTITDGGTFLCLAQTRVVWDIANLAALGRTPTGTATCTNTGRTPWEIQPSGNLGTRIILRNPTGNAWLINDKGEMQAIPDGGTYLCLATTNPIIWNTPNDRITAWEPKAGPATCGGDGGGGGGTPPTVRRSTIAAGGAHTCAMDNIGKAWCWGADSDGEVGDGPDSQAVKSAPVPVVGDRTYTTITAGNRHTCALDSSGKAWCWGEDSYGQVGDGPDDQQDKYAPVAVIGNHTFTTISVGWLHTCALDPSGQAWCWGSDENGELGNGLDDEDLQHAPVAVTGDHTFIIITVSDDLSTCALDAAGQAWCWGWDDHGSLGDGNAVDEVHHSPTKVTGGHTFSTIAMGYFTTCALDADGKAWCWGSDGSGQVGDGVDDLWIKSVPVAVAGDRTYTTITAGAEHSCALDADGKPWCWGNDHSGQVGDGPDNQENKYAPVAVAGDRAYTTITTRSYHTCALDAAGSAWCWGDDDIGQIGDGPDNQENKYAPVAVAGDRIWALP